MLMLKKKIIFVLFILISTKASKNKTYNRKPFKNEDISINEENKIELITFWQKKPKGRQFFFIKHNNQKYIGIFSWDLDKNCFKLEYPKVKWEIQNECLTQIKKNKSKNFKPQGILKLLTLPIEKWNQELIKNYEYEDHESKITTLLIFFENSPIIWQYKKDPFVLISLNFNFNGEFYVLEFNENTINENIDIENLDENQ